MNTSRILAVTMAALTLLALGACGGGGGGSTPLPVTPPPPPPTGGISGNGIAFGPITTFGSVVVNGVHYDTSNTSFTFDDNPSTEDQLEVGDIVIVKGTIDDDGINGTAESVESDDEVTGPIDSINETLGQLVVLGQLVQVGPDTSFEDTVSLATLSVGDIVEVHGFFKVDDPAGVDIEATRIENKSADGLPDDEVHGIVSNLDDVNLTFSLNDLVVDYRNARLDDSFPNGQISNGDFVEAKGTSSVINGVLTLVANSVELENKGIAGDDGDHVEVEGFITRFVSETDFDVAGVSVTTTSGTAFEGGPAADLGLNIKVEVEGALDANGILVADKVDIRRSKKVRAVALVDSVDSANESLVMLGITFTIDTLTRFEDKSDADLSPFAISDIVVGNYLEIRGAEFPAGSGQVLATILERDDPNTRTELQGFVETVAEPSLTILGVTIDTSAGTVFQDVDDSILSSADFFALVAQGSLVKARGIESADTMITATEVELESAQ